jgi:hypothetical protein
MRIRSVPSAGIGYSKDNCIDNLPKPAQTNDNSYTNELEATSARAVMGDGFGHVKIKGGASICSSEFQVRPFPRTHKQVSRSFALVLPSGERYEIRGWRFTGVI